MVPNHEKDSLPATQTVGRCSHRRWSHSRRQYNRVKQSSCGSYASERIGGSAEISTGAYSNHPAKNNESALPGVETGALVPGRPPSQPYKFLRRPLYRTPNRQSIHLPMPNLSYTLVAAAATAAIPSKPNAANANAALASMSNTSFPN